MRVTPPECYLKLPTGVFAPKGDIWRKPLFFITKDQKNLNQIEISLV
jgi:hypothetical protein